MNKRTVVVLFGGQSSEHQISCATAAGVLSALDREKWNVIPVGITNDGEWVPMPDDPELYRLKDGRGYTVPRSADSVSVVTGSPEIIIRRGVQGTEERHHVDVFFPLLHGPWGEDGTLQGLLELSNIRYVGCGVAASAVAMDKYLTKAVLAQAGIAVGRWLYVTPREWNTNRSQVLESVAELGMPVFVKPCRAGSSMGISKVTSIDELEASIDKAQSHDPRVLVEAASPGREIECGVLQLPTGELVAAPLGEIEVAEGDWYDYQTKYFDPDAVALHCPADLPVSVAAEIQKTAIKAFEALELEGLSRIDFFYDAAEGNISINEVNTLPGFTPFSMYPTMMLEAGYSYAELVDLLLGEALSRPAGLR